MYLKLLYIFVFTMLLPTLNYSESVCQLTFDKGEVVRFYSYDQYRSEDGFVNDLGENVGLLKKIAEETSAPELFDVDRSGISSLVGFLAYTLRVYREIARGARLNRTDARKTMFELDRNTTKRLQEISDRVSSRAEYRIRWFHENATASIRDSRQYDTSSASNFAAFTRSLIEEILQSNGSTISSRFYGERNWRRIRGLQENFSRLQKQFDDG